MIKKTTLALAAMIIMLSGANANNLTISGTSVTGSNISFNVSWDNSWRTNVAPNNYDAVWLFVKYQDCATNLWMHANLSATLGDHTVGSPLIVELPSDNKGVFLKRSANGGGNIASTAVTLKLSIPAGTYNYKVFGIEMVRVLQEDFQIGDGSAASTYNSITIDNAAQSTTGLTAVALGGGSAAVPTTFPMGYNAFYAMKYETSEQQYVDFLNTLTYDQQVSRTGIDPALASVGTLAIGSRTYRNGIVLDVQGNNNVLPGVFACDQTAGTVNNTDDAQTTPCGFVSWGDVSAYLDWAALRPMTEMEFEKICRGPLARVADEYPWGTTAINAITTASIVNPYTSSESSSTVANGLCHYNSTGGYVAGPIRCGFAATGSTGRASSGASYYGAMEMGGNLLEMCITTNNATGTAFNGTLGDGALTATGNANVATWPGSSAVGVGDRGSAFGFNAASYVETSNRTFASSVTYNPTRYQYNGCRGVR